MSLRRNDSNPQRKKNKNSLVPFVICLLFSYSLIWTGIASLRLGSVENFWFEEPTQISTLNHSKADDGTIGIARNESDCPASRPYDTCMTAKHDWKSGKRRYYSKRWGKEGSCNGNLRRIESGIVSAVGEGGVLLVVGSSFMEEIFYTICRCSTHVPFGADIDYLPDMSTYHCQLKNNVILFFYNHRHDWWGTGRVDMSLTLKHVKQRLAECYGTCNDKPFWEGWSSSGVDDSLEPWPGTHDASSSKLVVFSDLAGYHNLWQGPRHGSGSQKNWLPGKGGWKINGGGGDLIGWLDMRERIRDESRLLKSINARYVLMSPHYLCESKLGFRDWYALPKYETKYKTANKECRDGFFNNSAATDELWRHIQKKDVPPLLDTTNITLAVERACEYGIQNNNAVFRMMNIIKDASESLDIPLVDSWNLTKGHCLSENKMTKDGFHYAEPVRLKEWILLVDAITN